MPVKDRPVHLTPFGNHPPRDRFGRKPYERMGVPVTVCVASLFNWNYARADEQPRFGHAVVTASDQMITAGDIQYQPRQQKMALITRRVLILIAGEYPTHSEAIQGTVRQIGSNTDATPHQVALIYGQEIQRIRRRSAEDRILAPLGLNTDSFLAQQREMSDHVVTAITDQLLNFGEHEVEALVVGSDGAHAHIYYVDSRGTVRCMDDVGFHAIGVGAWHAKSLLMQSGYIKRNYAYALAQTFAAKRRAEIAPGVGSRTDMHLITADGWEPVDPRYCDQMERLYGEYAQESERLAYESVQKLQEFIVGTGSPEERADGSNQEGHGEAGEPPSETPQGDEAGERGFPRLHKDQEKGAAA